MRGCVDRFRDSMGLRPSLLPAQMARAQEIAPDLAVVIITGHGDMETAIQALRLGAADFLAKPVKLLELDAVLPGFFGGRGRRTLRLAYAAACVAETL